ncbi:MAG: hypothetical protein U9N54_13135 [candidate division Zixibacteria bacterium]|nr:hypothetical protein [candidate division Zixibacteria bacterium]
MRNINIIFIIFLLLTGSIKSEQNPKDAPEVFGLSHLTGYLGLTPDDISFRQDYTDVDSFRLQVVADLMNKPLDMPDYVYSLKNAYIKTQPEIIAGILFQDLARINQSERMRAYQANTDEIKQKYNLYLTDFNVNQLLSRAAVYLDIVIPKSLEMSLARLNKKQKKFLKNEFKELLTIREQEEFYSPDEIDSVDQTETSYGEQFAEFGLNIDKDPLISAGVDCLREMILEAKNLKAQLDQKNITIEQIFKSAAYIPENADESFYLGRQSGWKIGGAGTDYYNGEYKFILDFGGDDFYDLKYDPDNPHGTIIIDLSGDDVYRGQSDFVLGSGCFSVGILLDFEGNDIYEANSFSLGSAYFGFGVLYDKQGDDSYNGDTFIQGAGCFGLGLLIDENGRDRYTAANSAQGYAFVEGAGILYDLTGNDYYYIGGKYKDILRYKDHFYSFGQGFSIGFRPIFSGGIGALLDFEGNDNYISDIFAQASSYWWSLGILYDRNGNDSYQSFQYAQGAGTHMSLGMQIDEFGNDVYFSKGVSQGCGHDYSCGFLLDKNGDDTYTAYDLSQAAGSANGVGIMIDNNGNDRYIIHNPKNTHGYGNPRREFGSIGLFIDLNGTDQYIGYGEDNFYWRTDSKWGGGFDIEYICKDSAGVSK